MRVVNRDPDDTVLGVLLDQALAELKARYGPQVRSRVLPNARYFLAMIGAEAAGCGALQLVAPEVAEIKRMYVPERFRGRGIARAILRHLEEQAKAAGAVRVRLQTGTLQPEAIALYTSSGYARSEPWGRYASDPNSFCFCKALH